MILVCNTNWVNRPDKKDEIKLFKHSDPGQDSSFGNISAWYWGVFKCDEQLTLRLYFTKKYGKVA